MTRLAIRVSQDEECTRLDLDAPEGSLKVMQTAVEGWIEPVGLPGQDFGMYCNEEFLYTGGLQQNLTATAFTRQPILGPVIFTGLVDEDGETEGLTEAQALAVERIAEGARKFLSRD